MRRKKAIINSISSISSYITIFIVSLLLRRIFVYTLGAEYNGISGLFTNIMSMLSIAELGIGSSIIYNLYKPLKQDDWSHISRLMSFYKFCYHIIALVIMILGLCILPFLKYIVGEINIQESIYLLFILSLMDVVSTYLLSYKRSLFLADQKNYKIVLTHLVVFIVASGIKIVILILTKSFIGYLMIIIFFNIIENVVISCWCNKCYPLLKIGKEKINSEEKNDIFFRVKGIFLHRVGGVIVQGTDNIIISTFVNIITVGLYYNYNILTSAINSLIANIFEGLTPSVGNLLISSDNKEVKKTYYRLVFINTLLYTIVSSVLVAVISPFIRIWLGSAYVIDKEVVLSILLAFLLKGIRRVPDMFTSAAGIFYENRFIPIMECIINLGSSIVLVKLMGLKGVFYGTSIGSIYVLAFNFPIYLRKMVLYENFKIYIRKSFVFIMGSICIFLFIYFVLNNFEMDNALIELLSKGIISVLISVCMMIIFYRRTEEFNFTKITIINLLKKIINRKNR